MEKFFKKGELAERQILSQCQLISKLTSIHDFSNPEVTRAVVVLAKKRAKLQNVEEDMRVK